MFPFQVRLNLSFFGVKIRRRVILIKNSLLKSSERIDNQLQYKAP